LAGATTGAGADSFLGRPRRFGVNATASSTTSATSIFDLAGGNSNTLSRTTANLGVETIGCAGNSNVQGSGTSSNSSGSSAGAATSSSGCGVDAGIELGVEGLQAIHNCFKFDISHLAPMLEPFIT
jgi:hypothetical protein